MLERNANLFPKKTAIIYKKDKISYEEFYDNTNALSNFLKNIGFKKGESVGILTKKDPNAIIAFIGVAAAGGIVFPIDYNQTVNNLQYVLNLIKPSVLIIAAYFQPMLLKVNLPCSDDKVIVIGEKAKINTIHGGRF